MCIRDRKNLFSKDTFLTALESGLSGGASGALGGAVGTGLAKLNGGDASLLGQAKYHDRMDRMERAAAQQKEWEARAAEPSQSASPTAPPEGRATGVPGSSERTLEVLQGVRWRALRQREAAVDLRSRHWEPQPGSKAPFLKETPLKVCSGRKQLPQNRKIRRCGSLPKWRRATA